MYIQRTLEDVIKRASKFFPVVLVTGPRQVGKTTIFKNCDSGSRNYVSLDNMEIQEMAKQDPQRFLERYRAPLVIDEIQYAPQLLPYIKTIVDKEKKKGMYWLTGSQQFNLMANVTESLAGRAGILNLQGFSQSEKDKISETDPFLPDKKLFAQKEKTGRKKSVFHRIWKGSYPEIYKGKDNDWNLFYDSYLRTYIERDIKKIINISKETLFLNFIRVLAARTSQLINFANIAGEIGVNETTVKSWLSILQTSGLIYLLYPYSNNMKNRIIKTPKMYFLDTGLACFLTKWNTSETLENGAFSGAILETYAVSEILKSYWHNGKTPAIYFYRDKDKREVDIILEENGKLFPLEIKQKSNPNTDDIKNFSVLSQFKKEVAPGGVLCLSPTWLPLGRNDYVIPITYI
ncbi:MAG: ATP-binding protein [Treponema sp.]|jgi:predicted AAA+ superfamily ATPase|nr:ATP-binding protein [Treponema sp.]